MKEYALFLGCLIPARLPHLEAISIKVLDQLGVKTTDITDASCCPDPVVMKSLDFKSWLAIAARNLSMAEETASDILTLCSGCFSTLSKANHLLKHDDELRGEVSHLLSEINRSFSGKINVKHVVEIIRDVGKETIEQRVKKPLKQLKVASHPGCHLVRPSDVIHVDDPNVPTIQEEIVSWVGAKPVSYPLKMLCCGVGIKMIDPEANLLLLREKLADIKETEANCIVTPCPFCFMQFDKGQKEVNREFSENYVFPVFYITELLGLALGFSPDEVGLQFHATPVTEV
ncbi:MAG: CoB--CoM heterodisulfide reductase subunit B [Candidatus Bathyarchaeota archaeon]|nr:MAG: CoB--CoM heterodisulfide reductase subunit B [Candidatus Bathyarchaeota archaeon]